MSPSQLPFTSRQFVHALKISCHVYTQVLIAQLIVMALLYHLFQRELSSFLVKIIVGRLASGKQQNRLYCKQGQNSNMHALWSLQILLILRFLVVLSPHSHWCTHALQPWALQFIKFVHSMVHAYNYIIYTPVLLNTNSDILPCKD